MQDSPIKIDVTTIPGCVRDSLADATLEFIHDLLNNPRAREILEKKKAIKRVIEKSLGHHNLGNFEPQIEPQTTVLSK